MHWIAPSEKDAATDTLEIRLWAAADQYYLPVLRLIFLRFAEVHSQKVKNRAKNAPLLMHLQSAQWN